MMVLLAWAAGYDTTGGMYPRAERMRLERA